MPFNHNLSPSIQNQLSKKTLVPIVGPSSVGKTSVIRAVCEADPSFHRTVSFTTRTPREDEEPDTYKFLPNTDAQRREIIKKFEAGELIQFAIHPTTSFMYGTGISEYSGVYNLLDVLSSEVQEFQAMGFAACRTVMLVTTPDEWAERFDGHHFGPEESSKRIREGIDSLQWGLEHAGGVRWIENRTGDIASAVDHVIAIAHNELHENDARARQTGEQLLQYLKTRTT
jgi:guanylate kinase